MSGGSWDYLYAQEDLPSAEEMLRAHHRLSELGDPIAAAHASSLAALLVMCSETFDSLREALHDMEWVDSFDMGEDQFRKRAAERNKD